MNYPHGDNPTQRQFLMGKFPEIAKEILQIEAAWENAQTRNERIRLSDLHVAEVAKLYAREVMTKDSPDAGTVKVHQDQYEENANRNPYNGPKTSGSRVSPWPRPE